jgi:hypothetical protein
MARLDEYLMKLFFLDLNYEYPAVVYCARSFNLVGMFFSGSKHPTHYVLRLALYVKLRTLLYYSLSCVLLVVRICQWLGYLVWCLT